ncbi:MAG: DUF2203 domain-containing protein [Ignavibacteriales bacterium CG12_big_fil_rev_8_21_14_0_65_30_8]|nr:MAG: DUF2203 domain-containing protein [Ignavibacteriales bacterium CG12_big_fil_rev_8_21_14_0_65_30_8]
MLFEKYFTPAEAVKTLLLVKQIVRDILNSASELRLLKIGEQKDILDNPVIADHLQKINDYVEEIKELGCFYKDWNFEIGLVDFPSIINEEEVMLCWKSDETEIKYYHYYKDGFAGRKPIPEKYFVEEIVA